MRNYDDFAVADFIQDDYFLKWVKHPSQESDEFWEQWLKLHPDRKSELLQARMLILALDFKKTPAKEVPEEPILNRIRASIRNEGSETKAARTRPSQVWYRYAAAAAIIIAAVAALILYLGRWSPGYTTIQTAFDDRTELVLPDNSIVLLNANSTLRYRTVWDYKTPREVWLQGEAFFNVVKSDHPENPQFLVHTENLDVEVLGTTFNVVNRRGKTQVVLNTGKIRLTSETVHEKAITMQPGELAELSGGQETFTTRQVNPQLYTSWTNNQLIFQQSTLSDITRILEDNYGFTVRNTVTGMEDKTFTGTIPTVDLDTVLYVLSEAYNVEFKKEDTAIIISARAEVRRKTIHN